jgi:hypothetical protein
MALLFFYITNLKPKTIMKKFVLMLLLMIPLALIAQDTIPTPADPTTGPTDLWDFLLHFDSWIGTFAGVVLATAFLTTFFVGLLKVTKAFVKQIVSWAVAIILLVVTDLLNVGYAAEFPIMLAVIHGFTAGLASNGVFNIPLMKGILDAIAGWFAKKEEPPVV